MAHPSSPLVTVGRSLFPALNHLGNQSTDDPPSSLLFLLVFPSRSSAFRLFNASLVARLRLGRCIPDPLRFHQSDSLRNVYRCLSGKSSALIDGLSLSRGPHIHTGEGSDRGERAPGVYSFSLPLTILQLTKALRSLPSFTTTAPPPPLQPNARRPSHLANIERCSFPGHVRHDSTLIRYTVHSFIQSLWRPNDPSKW